MAKKKQQRPKTEHVAATSPNMAAELTERLRELVPEAFSEGKIDFTKLRATLGDLVDDRPERYVFSWAGKRDAIRLLQTPSRATLVPRPEESVNWDTTQHLFVEGDNLEVLKLLYKSYAGRVKMIYIDPPYNTGHDFIYPDNFADPLDTYLRLTGQADEEGNLLTSNPETSGRYHSAWLSMMYPRLFVARQLLREDGVILVSIDDNEVHNLRMLMNEVFGEENFIATVLWHKIFSPKNTARHFSEDHDYIVVYARNAELWQPNLLPRTDAANARYTNPDNDLRGPWTSSDLTARNYYSEGLYEVTSRSGRKYSPPRGRYWVVDKETFDELNTDNRIWWGHDGGNMPRLKRFLSEVKQGIVPQTYWSFHEVGHTQEAKKELNKYVPIEHTQNVLNTVKPTRLIQRMLQIATSKDDADIVLDFFAGSGPTLHAVLKQNHEDGGNRRCIMVQIPEPLEKPEKHLKTIADMATMRCRNAIDELVADNDGRLDMGGRSQPEDVGFRVFKLAESHYARWRGTAEQDADELEKQMEMFTDPLTPGWGPHNVIYEVLLKEGYSLTSRIEPVKKEGLSNTVYTVTDDDREQSFMICLDDKLDPKTRRALELTKEDLFICRDVALDDELAANLALQCRLKTI